MDKKQLRSVNEFWVRTNYWGAAHEYADKRIGFEFSCGTPRKEIDIVEAMLCGHGLVYRIYTDTFDRRQFWRNSRIATAFFDVLTCTCAEIRVLVRKGISARALS